MLNKKDEENLIDSIITDLEIESTASEKDEELEKYLKLFKEKFGRNAYFPEPHGTRELVIESIKKCLETDKDILDELYYPNDDPNILY